MNKRFLYTLVLIPIISSCSVDPGITPIYNDTGNLKIQFNSSDCEGKNYEDVLFNFKRAGFKNICVYNNGSKILDLFHEKGNVASVRINGDDKFVKLDYVSPSSVVFIEVINYFDGDRTCKFYVEPVDGKLPIMFSSSNCYYLGWKREAEEIGNFLEDIGFTNIWYSEIQDCLTKFSDDYLCVEKISVNGSFNYKDYDYFDTTLCLQV